MQSISSKTVQVIPNFLPNEWFDLPVLSAVNELYQVLHISTLDENKNPKGILEACRMLIAEGIINWHLTIVSEENFAELKKWVLNEKMDQYVSFRSHVPHNDIPNLYLNHHSFILNSNQETFSIVNAEALCFGLHLISTNVGFLKDHTEDWIDKIESGNVIDVKDKLKSAILNRKLSGKQGRTFVEKFKEDQILDQYDAIYKRLIG